jgi:hypothetical protein
MAKHCGRKINPLTQTHRTATAPTVVAVSATRSRPPEVRLGYLVVPRRYVIDQRMPATVMRIRSGARCHPGAGGCNNVAHVVSDGETQIAVTLSNGTGRPHRCGGIVSDSEHTAQTGGAVTSPKKTERQGSPPSASREPSDRAPSLDRRESVSARWREALSIVVELTGIGVLSAGFWLIRSWTGLIVLGAGLIVLGIASSPKFDRRRPPQ